MTPETMPWGVPPRRPDLIMGLDLGQSRDYTALVIADRDARTDPARYDVGHVERWRETRYPSLVKTVRSRIDALNVRPAGGGPPPAITLVVDHTGVGAPFFDMFLAADLGVPIVGVTITGGQAMTKTDDGWTVPKRVLASTLQVLLQAGRLRVSDRLALTPTLVAEMRNFRVKVSLGGHDSYGAGSDWRDDAHDDLVLAAALACWFGEHGAGGSWADVAAETDLRAFFGGR
ncbi:MAG: hypothetical protein ACR2OO_10130 [Thermomicrobiales bacterium]